MDRQIIQQNHIVSLNLWHQQLVNIGVENGSINCPLHAQRGNDTVKTQRTDHRQIHATITWHRLHRSRSPSGAPIESRHSQMKARFVNENKPLTLKARNFLAKQLSRFLVAFRSRKTFFCAADLSVVRHDTQSKDEPRVSLSWLSVKLIHQALCRSFLRRIAATLSSAFRLAKTEHPRHEVLVVNFRVHDGDSNIWQQCVARLKKYLRFRSKCLRPVRRHLQSFRVNPLSTLSC